MYANSSRRKIYTRCEMTGSGGASLRCAGATMFFARYMAEWSPSALSSLHYEWKASSTKPSAMATVSETHKTYGSRIPLTAVWMIESPCWSSHRSRGSVTVLVPKPSESADFVRSSRRESEARMNAVELHKFRL